MASWTIKVRFGAWGENDAFDRFRLGRLLAMLSEVSEETYRRFPQVESIYDGNVSYELRADDDSCCASCARCGDGNDDYADVLGVLERGTAACAPLSAAFVGELRADGERTARCAWDWREGVDRPYVHVVVKRADGSITDPSEDLLAAAAAAEE